MSSVTEEIGILKSLQGAAISAVAASILPNLPIKAIGRTFTIPNDNKYLELLHFPNNIDNSFWGSEKRYRGMFRLLLHWPNDDQGAYPPMEIIASIADYFAKGKIFQSGEINVQIYENPDFSGPVNASPSDLYPVSIRYQYLSA